MTCLLVVTPGADAAGHRLTGTLALHAPPHAEGVFGLVSGAAGVDLAPGLQPATSLDLRWARADGRLHGNDWTGVGGIQVSTPPRQDDPVSLPPGRLVGIECRAGCQVLLFSAGDGNLAVDAQVDGVLPFASEEALYWAEIADDVNGSFQRAYPPGSLLLGGPSMAGDARASGELVLFAKAALLRVETADGPATLDATADYQDVGSLGTLTRARSRFIVLHLHGASLHAPLSDVLVLAPSAVATLEGRLEASDASGHVALDGASRALDHGTLEIEGAMRFSWATVAPDAPASPLDAPAKDPIVGLDANAREAWIDGRMQSPLAPVEASASLVAVLLAALLVATRLALPLYSRISRDRVLGNENRRRLWERLAQEPGQTVTALARACGISRVVVRHHMALLAAHGLVTCVARGRRKLYFPAGQAPPPDAVAIQAALADPSRLLIAQAIARPGTHATQVDLARATGFSPRVVSYHLAQLERLGLVQVEGSWRRTYRATPRLAASLERAARSRRREMA